MKTTFVTGVQMGFRFLAMDNILSSLLLLCALISILLFQNYNIGFEQGHHGYLSSHGMTLSKSLFASNRFPLMFTKKSISDDGRVSYDVYNRFPFFPFLITGAVTRAFEPNLSLQVYIARQVMNLFFIFSIIICFYIVKGIIHNSFLSLSIVLMSFSSCYMLYYNDMIFNDIPSLFGFTLALFLVVKSQIRRLNLLLIVFISIISISMGWQPYAVFVSWFLIDAIRFIATNKLSIGKYSVIVTCPSFIALISAIIWGTCILSFQLINEWIVIGGSFQNIPTVKMAVWRLGFAPEQSYAQYHNFLEWHYFLLDQIRRIVRMIIPFGGGILIELSNTMLLVFMVSVIGLLLIAGFVIYRHKLSYIIVFVFLFSGVLWALLMRHFVVFHNFQSIFFIGFPIIFFIILSFYFHLSTSKISKILAVIICLLFIFSVWLGNIHKGSIVSTMNHVTQEFQSIYKNLPKDSTVFVEDNCYRLSIAPYAINFYLINTYFTTLEKAEYVISTNPTYNHDRLTDNVHVNLFKNSK